MIRFSHHDHDVPGLNTASLPDLIFSVLFFFMIVTHMRQDMPRVTYKVPEGSQLQQQGRKQDISHIYIGRTAIGAKSQVQIGDALVPVKDLTNYISGQVKQMSPEDVDQLTVSIKADRQTPMGVVADVRDALRQAGVKRVSYAGENMHRHSSSR